MGSVLLPVHITSGGLAIILGALALLVAKGGTVHRRSGTLFVFAMLTMGVSGSLLAIRHSWADPNVMGGVMSAYFVLTALAAVRRPSAWTQRLNIAALAIGISLVLIDVALAVVAYLRPHHALNGVPFFMPVFLALTMTLAATGDLRVLRERRVRAGPRLARHLWRMCFALFIAAGSFFSIPSRVAKILPAPFTTPMMRALPVLLVFLAMFYWLWRVRGFRGLTVRTAH